MRQKNSMSDQQLSLTIKKNHALTHEIEFLCYVERDTTNELEKYFNKYLVTKEALIKKQNICNDLSIEIENILCKLDEAHGVNRDLKARNDACVEELAFLRKENIFLGDKLNQLKEGHETLKKENAQLLYQASSTMEELERYFMNYTATQDRANIYKLFLDKACKNFSHYIDYTDFSVDKDAGSSCLTWKFENIFIAGRLINCLKFQTVFTSAMDCLIFKYEDNSDVFIRWPSLETASKDLVIFPVNRTEKIDNFIRTIQGLALTDFVMICALGYFFCNTSKVVFDTCSNFAELNYYKIKSGFTFFFKTFRSLPPLFQYDFVQVKREQVNIDYEHIWLNLNPVCFSGKRLESFEFRISCAIDDQDGFGRYTKIEFPECAGVNLFEKWYSESVDDFSCKLELRFDLPEKVDLDVWNSVSDRDRILIKEIMMQIPTMLKLVASQGFTPTRGWKDWLKAVDDMNILITMLDVKC